ncbi:MAG: hypothetical protein GF401_08415 [Chitinivibrionales bacterium]|nr:hypothetical protein [Chitinivibrionales bacterium]
MKSIKYQSQSIIFILIVLGFIAVANFVLTKWFVRFDLTENKVYSISDASKRILKDLDDIVNVKCYFSKDLPPNLKSLETDVRDILSEYKAYAGKNIRISWVDPAENDEIKSKVRALGIPEVRLQTFEKDKAQVMNGYLGIAVLYADKKEVLPVVQDLKNFEYDLTSAIMKVMRSSVPKVGVLKTDTNVFIPPEVRMKMKMDYTDPTESKYKPVFDNLKENYEVETIDITDGQQISSDIKTLLVLGGDENSFSERDLFEIDQYFMKGGNLIVAADAVGINFQRGAAGEVQNPKILNLLEHYGARVENNMVLDASCGNVQIPQKFGAFQMNVAVPYPYFVKVFGEGFNKNNPAVSSLGELILPWPSSVTLLVDKADSASESSATDEKEAKVLVQSSEKSWTTSGQFNLNPQQQWQPPEDDLNRSNLMVYLNGSFESHFAGKSIPPAKEPDTSDIGAEVLLSEKDKDREIVPQVENGHLIIAGDSDFLTAQNASPGSITWLMNVVDWLTLDESLISIRSRSMVDRTIQNDQLGEGTNKPNVIRIINIVLMPLIVIIVGIVIFFKRKEKKAVPAKATSSPTPQTGAPEEDKTKEQNS